MHIAVGLFISREDIYMLKLKKEVKEDVKLLGETFKKWCFSLSIPEH